MHCLLNRRRSSAYAGGRGRLTPPPGPLAGSSPAGHPAGAFFRRKGDHRAGFRQLQILPDLGQISLHFAFLHLVQLLATTTTGSRESKTIGPWYSRYWWDCAGRPQSSPPEPARLGEIALHEFPPALLFCAADLGVAVARQIHEVNFSIYRK